MVEKSPYPARFPSGVVIGKHTVTTTSNEFDIAVILSGVLIPDLRRAIALPPFRILLAFGLVGLVYLLGGSAAIALGASANPYGWAAQITRAFVAATTVAVLLLVDTRVERLRVKDLGFEPRSLPQLAGGLLVGVAMVAVVIAIEVLKRWYRVEGLAVPVGRIPLLAGSMVLAFLLGAVFQESLFRGILFRGLESWLGSWSALVISSLLFGLFQALQPHATVVSSLASAIGGGALLGAAYMATRNLWLAIGLHAGIDFVLVGVYGWSPGAHLFQSSTEGPALWTGGAFGLNFGAVYLLVAALVTLLLLVDAVRRGYVVPFRGRAESGFETTQLDS